MSKLFSGISFDDDIDSFVSCLLRFIRTEEDDMDTSWEQRLVKRYYEKLFKEYLFLRSIFKFLILF